MYILISCRVGAEVPMFLKIDKTTTSLRERKRNHYCEKVSTLQCWVTAATPSACQQTSEVQEVTDD